MKKIVFLFSLIVAATCVSAQTRTLHDFTVSDIAGDSCDLSTLKGHKVLVVNVASKCGLTPQYADLQKLYETHRENGLVIVAFPCNDFLGQEPGTHEEIATFCETNYGVTFPLMAKVSIKSEPVTPLYRWLTERSENGVMDAEIKWNFQKVMIDEQGRIVDHIAPQEPFVERISAWVAGK